MRKADNLTEKGEIARRLDAIDSNLKRVGLDVHDVHVTVCFQCAISNAADRATVSVCLFLWLKDCLIVFHTACLSAAPVDTLLLLLRSETMRQKGWVRAAEEGRRAVFSVRQRTCPTTIRALHPEGACMIEFFSLLQLLLFVLLAFYALASVDA